MQKPFKVITMNHRHLIFILLLCLLRVWISAFLSFNDFYASLNRRNIHCSGKLLLLVNYSSSITNHQCNKSRELIFKSMKMMAINEGFSCSISLIVGIIIFCQQMVHFCRLNIIEGCFLRVNSNIKIKNNLLATNT